MSRMTTMALVTFLFVVTRANGDAATTASAQPIRIAYVDVEGVVSNSEVIKGRVSSAEKNLSKRENEYELKDSELRDLRQKLAKQESVMTAAQVEELKQKIQKLQGEKDYLEYESKRIFDATRREMTESVLDEVTAAVERVAKTYQIDLVLSGPMVLYHSERIDLTDTVTRELDRAAKTAAKSVSPASPPERRSPSPEEIKKSSGEKKSGPGASSKKIPKTDEGSSK